MVEQEAEKIEKAEKKERFNVVEVVTQVDYAIQDSDTGKVYSDKELLLLLANKLNTEVIKV